MELNIDKPVESAIEVLFNNLEKPQYDADLISTINETLKNHSTRLMGLELIQVVVSRCSEDIIMDNVLTWTNYCNVNYTEDTTKEVKLKTLGIIIKSVSNVELLNKKFTSEFLNNILKACLSCQTVEEKIVSLECLTHSIGKFPIWFGHHKEKIELYLTECLDNPLLTNAAAQCFMAYLRIGPAGVNGINYINNFSSNYQKLYWSIHFLYNKFCKYFPQLDNKFKIEGDIFHFKSKNENPDLIFNRLINTLTFLKTILLKKHTVEKRFVPYYIIDIIYRGTSTNYCFCQTPELKHSSILLRKLYHHLLELLRIYIQAFGIILIPFSLTIQNMFINILRKSGQCKCSDLDIYYKTSVYKTMNLWFSSNRIVNETQTVERLIPIIMKDITPVRKDVLLKTKVPEVKKTVREVVIENIRSESYCLAALEALDTLFKTSVKIDQNILELVLNFITKTLGAILVDKKVELYNDTQCQIKLYDILLTIFSLVNVNNLPSLHWLIDILNKGLVGNNWKIVRKCSDCLDVLEKISHPRCPTLFLGNARLENTQSMEMEEVRESECVVEETADQPIVTDSLNATVVIEETPDDDLTIIEVDDEKSADVEETQVNDDKNLVVFDEDISELEKEMDQTMEIIDLEQVDEIPPERKMEESLDEDMLDEMFSSFKDTVQE